MKEATIARALNDVRSALVKDFNGYTGGNAFFGEKLMPITASSGTYKVVISYDEEQAENTITVRRDPLD